MSSAQPLRCRLKSDAECLPGVRERIRAWLTARGCAEQPTAEVVLAVDEALTNVIRHGYGGRAGKRIDLDGHDVDDPQRGAGVEIVIRDYAPQVPLDSICGRDLDDLRPGGLGVHIIRNVMDEAQYTHAEGGGMRLVMRKYFEADSEQEASP